MKALALLLTASLITSLGIVLPSLWLLVFPGLALFIHILRRLTRRVWGAALYGLIFGVTTGGAGTIWFWDTLPLSFLGINDPLVQKVAVGMTWGYVATSLGLPVIAGALVIWKARSSRWFPLVTILTWVLTEIARMWSFAITTWGQQSLFGPHFSAASLGYALTESHTLLRIAYPLGIDALNLVVASIAVALALAPTLFKEREERVFLVSQMALALTLCCLPSVAASSATLTDAPPLRFAIIAENIDDVRDVSTHTLVTQLLAEVAAARPPVDVVVLPEEFSLTSIFWSKDEASRFISHHFGEREVLILNTRNELYPEDERNENPESKKLIYDSTTRGEVGRYVKQMLMPLGEYAPALTKTFFSIVQDPELQLYIEDVSTAAPPPRGTSVTSFRGVTIGGLLCSDMLSPHLYRSLVRDHGARVLVNLSNHFWFHGSRPLYWKTIQMARVHAVQNRTPILVSNNVAPSFALDSTGAPLVESSWGKREVLYVNVPVNGGRAL